MGRTSDKVEIRRRLLSLVGLDYGIRSVRLEAYGIIDRNLPSGVYRSLIHHRDRLVRSGRRISEAFPLALRLVADSLGVVDMGITSKACSSESDHYSKLVLGVRGKPAVSKQEEVEWVANNVGFPWSCFEVSDIPSPGALFMLRWAKDCEDDFRSRYDCKLTPGAARLAGGSAEQHVLSGRTDGESEDERVVFESLLGSVDSKRGS